MTHPLREAIEMVRNNHRIDSSGKALDALRLCDEAEKALTRIARAEKIIAEQRGLLLEYISARNAGRNLHWRDHKPTYLDERVRTALTLTLDEEPKS